MTFCRTGLLGIGLALLLAASSIAHAEWIPPEDPDLEKIREDAVNDANAGNYEDALARHLWFHHNSLSIDPDYLGVRVSHEIEAWLALGEKYPPARKALIDTRDDADKSARSGDDYLDGFSVASFINLYLGDHAHTAELFRWLDSNRPGVARETYEMAQPSLIREEDFELCNNYLDVDAILDRELEVFRESIQMTKDVPALGEALEGKVPEPWQ